MLEFPRWKYALIVLVVLVSAWFALPNIFPSDPSVQITPNRGFAIDDALVSRVNTSLKAVGITPLAVDKQAESLLVRLSGVDLQTKANDALRDDLGEDYTVALSLASTVPEWMLGAKPMTLGLDLRGGVHFVMQVDQKAALDKRVDAYAEDMRVTLRDKRVRYESVERAANNTIVVTIPEGDDVAKARAALATTANASAAAAAGTQSLTYDVQGNRIVVTLPKSELDQITGDAIEQNITTLRNRVAEVLGDAAEPVIQRQGDDRVVVQLPGVQDTAAAKRLIGATATLEFHSVVDGNAYDAVASGNVPPEARIYYQRELGADGKPIPVLLSKRVLASGDQMVTARAGVDQNGLPAVDITLNNAAGQRILRIAVHDRAELEGRGGADQALGGGSVLHAGQLHDHAVGTLTLDDGFGNAKFVDAVAQGGDVLFDRITGDLQQFAFRQGHHDLVAVDVVGHARGLRAGSGGRRGGTAQQGGTGLGGVLACSQGYQDAVVRATLH